MCNVYTDVCGKKSYTMVCQHVREIIHSLKLVGYLHVHADKPWYMYIYYKSNERAHIWASAWDFQQCSMCDQQSLRSACAYAQSDQSLC